MNNEEYKEQLERRKFEQLDTVDKLEKGRLCEYQYCDYTASINKQ